MNTGTLTYDELNTGKKEPGFLSKTFHTAGEYALKGITKVGELAYEFFKANPILCLVGADLAITGGTFTQKALVSTVTTVGGAAADISGQAATGLWHMINPFD